MKHTGPVTTVLDTLVSVITPATSLMDVLVERLMIVSTVTITPTAMTLMSVYVMTTGEENNATTTLDHVTHAVQMDVPDQAPSNALTPALALTQ